MIAAALVLSVFIAASAAVAIVYRRQRSVDAQTAKSVDDSEHLRSLQLDLADLTTKHRELRDEYDRLKLLVPRPQGR